MIEHLVPEGSTYAADVDHVIVLVAVLAGFWFFAAQGMFFWLIFRFRQRDGVNAQYITGMEKNLKKWVSRPHMAIIFCDVAIIVASVNVWYNIKQRLPEPDTEIRITGQQWAWTFVDPGPDNELDTEDDITTVDELHVEAGKVYQFHLGSLDVVHSLSIPIFRLKQDAVPGRVISGWFEATDNVMGEHSIQCAEICGIGHAMMRAALYIETPAEHADWVSQHAPSTRLAAVSQ